MTAVTTIRADVLKGLLLCAAKEDVRYYLVGIYFDTARDVLVATDGHRMFLHKCALPKDVKPFIMSRSTAEQAIKMTSKRANDLEIAIDAEGSIRRIELKASNGALVMGPEVDGQFPDWQRVVPKKCTFKAAQYSAAYLKQMQEAFALASDNSKACPSVLHNGDGPGLVVSGNPDMMGIVMPMRDDVNLMEKARIAAYASFNVHQPKPESEEALAA